MATLADLERAYDAAFAIASGLMQFPGHDLLCALEGRGPVQQSIQDDVSSLGQKVDELDDLFRDLEAIFAKAHGDEPIQVPGPSPFGEFTCSFHEITLVLGARMLDSLVVWALEDLKISKTEKTQSHRIYVPPHVLAAAVADKYSREDARCPLNWDCQTNFAELRAHLRAEYLKAAESLVQPPRGGKHTVPSPKAGVNARMLEVLQNDVNARGWTARKWAEHLGCSDAAICKTTTWKDLQSGRERMRAEQAVDRRGRGTNRRSKG